MKTCLITGANKGIGLEFARQLKAKGFEVIGCCRDLSKAEALQAIADKTYLLDVTKDAEITELSQILKDKPIDLLINNAGISGISGVTIGNVDRVNFLSVLDVNCLSVIKVSEALLPNIQRSLDKNILVISSQMGSISDNNSGRSYAYRASKAALNAAMRSFAIDVEPLGVHVMLMHPGWVKTDMGGSEALVSVSDSVAGMLAEAERHFPNSHAEVIRRFDGGTVSW